MADVGVHKHMHDRKEGLQKALEIVMRAFADEMCWHAVREHEGTNAFMTDLKTLMMQAFANSRPTLIVEEAMRVAVEKMQGKQ